MTSYIDNSYMPSSNSNRFYNSNSYFMNNNNSSNSCCMNNGNLNSNNYSMNMNNNSNSCCMNNNNNSNSYSMNMSNNSDSCCMNSNNSNSCCMNNGSNNSSNCCMNNNKCDNNSSARADLLKQIMSLDFALTELQLYLDNHPEDEKALCLYRKYAKELRDLKESYQKVYGPLTKEFPCNKWRWLEEPWPWEGGIF